MAPRYQRLRAHLYMHRHIDTHFWSLSRPLVLVAPLPPPGHSSLLLRPLHSPSVPKAKAGGTLSPGCRAPSELSVILLPLHETTQPWKNSLWDTWGAHCGIILQLPTAAAPPHACPRGGSGAKDAATGKTRGVRSIPPNAPLKNTARLCL